MTKLKGIAYKNYFIHRREDGQYNILQQVDGLVVTTAPSEEAAIQWIDRERAQMRRDFRE